ncbi:ribosomal RNA assembly protein [Fonticula alba]|uniref:Ribosomal RNA assembly protein n=1 Tax=Fonticula alba TaxID=691883 RepID=A0A058Z2G2_FONAL|nr:ribosomal RNA assembly protein [Fonticula alba]KCV67712.1 ribosomal RNA assembly protein [Fonticula alba]|eukprot:XP_009497896.1 ribosomal RNA assembly protein [Fonticula alba]
MEIDDVQLDLESLNYAATHDGGEFEDDGSAGVAAIDPEIAGAGASVPSFRPLTAGEISGGKRESRKIPVPGHRFTPLKDNWMKIYTPLVEHMMLQVRMNLRSRRVEIRTCEATNDPGAIQKGADFLRAFMLGFDVEDAMALLRMDDLYIDSFEMKDVKTLNGDHLGRAVGRVAGHGGRTKFTIENTTRTRIVLAETHIHILGTFQNIAVARDAIVSLILGSPPGKVYNHLRAVSTRLQERF